jgi:hypothetical protein
MRKFLQLAAVLLVAVVAAGSPLATLGSPPAAAPVAMATVAATPVAATPQAVAVPGLPSSPALVCILPQCDGKYCRASNGCWVCCPH